MSNETIKALIEIEKDPYLRIVAMTQAAAEKMAPRGYAVTRAGEPTDPEKYRKGASVYFAYRPGPDGEMP